MVVYFIYCHGYHALLVLGKDIPLKYVFKHIFLSIVLFKPDNHFSFPLGLFKPSCDLYDISRNNSLLIKRLDVQLGQQDLVTIVDDIPVAADG